MIRPSAFGFNPETAQSNAFQKNLDIEGAPKLAVSEFDAFVETLRSQGVIVEVFQDRDSPAKPDAVFPNNWVSFHEGGKAIVYPMANPSRQSEVDFEIIRNLGYEVELDLRQIAAGKALEGTGSLVLDRRNKIAYACISPRTDEVLLSAFSTATGFEIVPFTAFSEGKAIYHTNVVMAVGENTLVACVECITDPTLLKKHAELTHKQLLEISPKQMAQFAGNLLQLRGSEGLLWILSASAMNSLTEVQKAALSHDSKLVCSDLTTIETLGGGSARCMIAELF